MKYLAITSSHNPRYRAALLLRNARDRARMGRFLIDGSREIDRALKAGIEIVEWYSLPDDRDGQNPNIASLARRNETDRGTSITIPQSMFEQLAYGERTPDIIAVALSPPPAALSLPPCPLVAVVEGIEKPGNLGAMLRTGCAAGVSAFMLTDRVTDLYNPNVIRASTGAVFAMPTYRVAPEEARNWLASLGLQILAARVDATRSYEEIDLSLPTAIVLGSEAHGLSQVWDHPAVTPVRVPMSGVVDSLNVSVTAAILFYEARRQRAAKRVW